jgi:hypothetical protein
VPLVAGDQALEPQVGVDVDVPALREQVAHRPERAVEQQVVALGHDERDGAGHRQGARLGELQLAAEHRGVHDVVGALEQASQQLHVPRGVEGVRCPLAVLPAEPGELGVGEVEAVHGHEDGTVAERLDERCCQGRLAGARGPVRPRTARPGPAARAAARATRSSSTRTAPRVLAGRRPAGAVPREVSA